MKILFILKERFYSNAYASSYGLINSSKYVQDFIHDKKIGCKIVSVIDYNSIDKEVFEYDPDIVIIEALWVSADKLKELASYKRYENIKWVIRVHSDIGFLCTETLALKYINDYIELKNPNVIVSLNNETFVKHLSKLLEYDFLYLPNIISIKPKNDIYLKETKYINIGCFGSLRILKNQCFQAVCAMHAADKLNKILKFHITIDLEITPKNNAIYKNLIELFKNSKHQLIVHNWLNNDKFNDLIKTMDLGLQVSFTETFNIVSADFVNNDRLIIISNSIDWLPSILKVSTIDYKNVVKRIIYAYKFRNSSIIKNLMRKSLKNYNKKSIKVWDKFLLSKSLRLR